MNKLVMALVVVVILVLLALVMCGCASKRGTSRETAVQTPDHTGLTWWEPVKGATR